MQTNPGNSKHDEPSEHTIQRGKSSQRSSSLKSRMPLQRWPFTTLIMNGMLLAGCGVAVDPLVLESRVRFLTTQPSGIEQPVADVRKAIQSGELKSETPLTIRVRINAGEVPPFIDGVARFFVTDATGHDGDESHDPHECPFCRRDVKTMMALVEFRDADGQVIPIDTRTLFDIKEFELLVLEGTGHLDSDEILVVSASRMFVKR